MHFNAAVLKETQPDERRAAPVSSVSGKAISNSAEDHKGY